MNGWPITKYQISQIKKTSKVLLIVLMVVLVVGNILTAAFITRVRIQEGSYALKEGFPMFTSAKSYISLLKSYPHDPGTKIKIHTVSHGESLWNIARAGGITVDTLIAANPFLGSLLLKDGMQIAVPAEDGVLMPIDGVLDVYRMAGRLDSYSSVEGDYLHSIFRLLSPDDMRFAFFKGARPAIVSDAIQPLYNIRLAFQSPVKGALYSSFYGDRVNPMHEGTGFHNGVDLQVRMGTPIRPVRNGIVTYTGWHEGYGLMLTVQHEDGYISMYGHCLSIRARQGEWVSKKDVIALVGSTGHSTGPHLHFMMMRHGRMLNPILFIW